MANVTNMFIADFQDEEYYTKGVVFEQYSDETESMTINRVEKSRSQVIVYSTMRETYLNPQVASNKR